MDRLLNTLWNYAVQDQTLSMRQRLYRLTTLVTGLLCIFVILQSNIIMNLPVAVNVAVGIFGMLSLFFYRLARDGREHVTLFLLSLIVVLDVVWFPNAGSNGSIIYYFFPAFIVPMVFYRGNTRWLMTLLLGMNACALLVLDYFFPSAVTPFHTPHDRLLDLLTGVFCSFLAGATMLWVVVANYDWEQDRIEKYALKLAESEKKYRELVETANSVILTWDRQGRISFINEFGERFFGFSKDELIGRNIIGTIVPSVESSGRNLEQLMREIGKTPDHYRDNENENVTRDGRRVWLHWGNRAILDDAGEVVAVLSIGNDITEKKKLEEQLLQSQKMDAIGRLAGGVSHDFNNILTAIIGYATVIKMQMAPDDPLRLDMDHLLQSVDRAAQLTQSLLTFSRKQSITLKPVRPNEIIARIDKFLRRIIGEDVQLQTALGVNASVLADGGQLEQVLMNLAVNARDAMPKGGTLSIKTEVVALTANDALLRGVAGAGDYMVISVADSGVGMDDITRKQIFEPFFTTKEMGRGTGLGLAIVYGIIKQHKGQITVRSQKEIGTTFSIHLAVHHGAVSAHDEIQEEATLLGGVETIMIVEDDQAIRTFFDRILARCGYTVITAEDGVEAVELFSTHRDAIRLCIFDMIMPRKGGREAFDEIRRQRPDIKAIFMSGYTPEKILNEGIPAECPFLQKPVAPHVLLKTIRETLDTQQSEPPKPFAS